ncbi:MAG: hypothetical protein ABH828_06465 [archaeon]
MKLWFKSKSYGYGWVPASKEGWIVTLLFVCAIIYIGTTYAETNITLFFLYLLIALAIFLGIAFYTGETPHWNWGKKK